MKSGRVRWGGCRLSTLPALRLPILAAASSSLLFSLQAPGIECPCHLPGHDLCLSVEVTVPDQRALIPPSQFPPLLWRLFYLIALGEVEGSTKITFFSFSVSH